MAYSMSHDHHNIVTAGVDDGDMAAAVNEVARLHRGLAVVCGGRVLASMELPIGGLMSEEGPREVEERAGRAEPGCGFPGLRYLSPVHGPELYFPAHRAGAGADGHGTGGRSGTQTDSGGAGVTNDAILQKDKRFWYLQIDRKQRMI